MSELERPDGKSMIKWGLRVLVLGVATAVFSKFFDPFYFVNDPISESVKFNWLQSLSVIVTALAFTLIPFGFLTWLAGKVIFAISFLPSKNDSNAPNQ